MELHGFLVVDKPRGVTSHDVVTRVRRLLGTKRVGHAGTLDPAAEGILILGVGRATKLLDVLQASHKTYLAQVALGATSGSGDIEGPGEGTVDPPPVTTDAILRALARFVGEIEQVPPLHSAVKIDGQPAYRHARRGTPLQVPARRVTIFAISLLGRDVDTIDLEIECSAGTYIRSLARDVGETLGTGAYLHALLRTRSGAFRLADAWTLDELDRLLSVASFSAMALHPASALPGAALLILNGDQKDAWYDGRLVTSQGSGSHASQAVAFSRDGDWVGSARASEGPPGWQPRLVVGRG